MCLFYFDIITFCQSMYLMIQWIHRNPFSSRNSFHCVMHQCQPLALSLPVRVDVSWSAVGWLQQTNFENILQFKMTQIIMDNNASCVLLCLFIRSYILANNDCMLTITCSFPEGSSTFCEITQGNIVVILVITLSWDCKCQPRRHCLTPLNIKPSSAIFFSPMLKSATTFRYL